MGWNCMHFYGTCPSIKSTHNILKVIHTSCQGWAKNLYQYPIFSNVVWFFKTHLVLCQFLDWISGYITFGFKFMKPRLHLWPNSCQKKKTHLDLWLGIKIFLTPNFAFDPSLESQQCFLPKTWSSCDSNTRDSLFVTWH
jgi:hypothetical protein